INYNIQTNCITYGVLEEDFSKYSEKFQKEFAKVMKYTGARLCRARDVAGNALFLASGKADCITGQTHHLNGGLII
ncbi:MAG: SDR family oxidoreductase, partial [Oligoflexales bacterium]|nr:SDR family oxidoreductase [Oligoflexales bacterium]